MRQVKFKARQPTKSTLPVKEMTTTQEGENNYDNAGGVKNNGRHTHD